MKKSQQQEKPRTKKPPKIIRTSVLKATLKRKNLRTTYNAKVELENSLKQYNEILLDLAKVLAQKKKRKQITDRDVWEAKRMLLYPGKAWEGEK